MRRAESGGLCCIATHDSCRPVDVDQPAILKSEVGGKSVRLARHFGLLTGEGRVGGNLMSKDSSTKTPLPGFDFADVGKLGQKQADAFLDMQRQLWNLVEEANRSWVARAQLERDLASDLANQLSAAKTLPDVAKVYQDWAGRRLQVLADDNRRLVADSQKLMSAATQFFSTNR
jgi:hypothetical protein